MSGRSIKPNGLCMVSKCHTITDKLTFKNKNMNTNNDSTTPQGNAINTVLYAVCPECGGDGKETCTNPDHGFISVLGFHDIGRIGCPCCGHDPDHKVINGGKCEVRDGTGKVTMEVAEDYVAQCDYEIEIVPWANCI